MAGIVIARFMRKNPWWFQSHRALGICGISSMVLGLATAIYMVAESGEEHFEVLHANIGAIVVFSSQAVAVPGQLQFRWKNRRAAIQGAHRWAAAMTLILLSLNILSGVVLAGVLPDMRFF